MESEILSFKASCMCCEKNVWFDLCLSCMMELCSICWHHETDTCHACRMKRWRNGGSDPKTKDLKPSCCLERAKAYYQYEAQE